MAKVNDDYTARRSAGNGFNLVVSDDEFDDQAINKMQFVLR